MPSLVLTAVLAVVLAAWALVPEQVTVSRAVAGVGTGVVVVLLVGLIRVRSAARAVCLAQEQAAQRLVGAVGAIGNGVQRVVEDLRRGSAPSPVDGPAGGWAVDSGQAPHTPGSVGGGEADAFTGVERALGQLQAQMVRSVREAHEQSQLAIRHVMFRHIARREHVLIMRLLDALEDLQGQIKSAALLNRVFQIDNMAVRLRRMVDSLAILGGESASAVRRPVPVTSVLRGAVQAIEQYDRARVSGSEPALALPGHVAPDVTNLLAELVENATVCSPPATTVVLRAERVAAGLVVEVTDRGKGLSPEHRQQVNTLLAAPHTIDFSAQLEDGRLGLLVVGMTAQRHRILVRLDSNLMGGTTAMVVIPHELLVDTAPPPEIPFPEQPVQQADRPAPMAAPPASVSGGVTARGLPQRHPARPAAAPEPQPGDLPLLPVRPASLDTVPEAPGAAVGGPAAVTHRPHLAGQFRHGHQRSAAADKATPFPAPTSSE